MADYQLAHLSLSTRLELTALMLNPLRPWGQATQLSRQYGVSRKFLYALRRKAIQGLVDTLLPRAPGRKAQTDAVVICHFAGYNVPPIRAKDVPGVFTNDVPVVFTNNVPPVRANHVPGVFTHDVPPSDAANWIILPAIL